MKHRRGERGSAAVEFALIAPLLVTLVVGIAEFGRVYNLQTTMSGAAREGVRVMALKNSASDARSAVIAAAGPSVALTSANISITPVSCVSTPTTNVSATVTVSYPTTFFTSMFGKNITITGKGVMRCGG